MCLVKVEISWGDERSDTDSHVPEVTSYFGIGKVIFPSRPMGAIFGFVDHSISDHAVLYHIVTVHLQYYDVVL